MGDGGTKKGTFFVWVARKRWKVHDFFSHFLLSHFNFLGGIIIPSQNKDIDR